MLDSIDRFFANLFALAAAGIGGCIIYAGVDAIRTRQDYLAGISWILLGAIVALFCLAYVGYGIAQDIKGNQPIRRIRENAQMCRNRLRAFLHR